MPRAAFRRGLKEACSQGSRDVMAVASDLPGRKIRRSPAWFYAPGGPRLASSRIDSHARIAVARVSGGHQKKTPAYSLRPLPAPGSQETRRFG